MLAKFVLQFDALSDFVRVTGQLRSSSGVLTPNLALRRRSCKWAHAFDFGLKILFFFQLNIGTFVKAVCRLSHVEGVSSSGNRGSFAHICCMGSTNGCFAGIVACFGFGLTDTQSVKLISI